MDAPPQKEDVEPYLRIAGMLDAIGVNAPRILARNAPEGFLLLTDLGSTTYLAELARPARAAGLYSDAIDALVRSRPMASSSVPSCHPTTRSCCVSR